MNNRSAFTLVETIVATVILAGSVVAIATITSRSLDAVRLDAEYQRAWDALDRQLAVIGIVGVATLQERGISDGKFALGGVEYTWYVDIAEEEYEGLYRVDLAMVWDSGGRGRRISASTMYYGTQEAGEETELPEDEGDVEDGSAAAAATGEGT